MAEILTESFCERCGTRYTFESTAPKARRLGGIKTLSRGLKNFVMSDDSSLDEALAAARSDAERETTAQQLDAFHKTFNFCMSCRQYTCGNCWNTVDGRCLTCAPHLGHEILPAPFPDLDGRVGLIGTFETNGAAVEPNGHEPGVLAWPTADLRRADDADVEAEDASTTQAAPARLVPAWPVEALEPEVEPAAVMEPDVEQPPLDAETAETAAIAVGEPAEPEAVELVAEPVESGPVELVAEPVIEPAPVEPEPLELVAEPVVEPELVVQPVELVAEPVVEPAPVEREPVVSTNEANVDDRAAAAAAQTAALLARFRPGQSLDAALDAFEASLSAVAPVEAEAAVARPDAAAAAEPEVAPEPAAAPAVAAEAVTELAPEPVAAAAESLAAAPAPEAVPARPDDRVLTPGWQIVAPDTAPRTADGVPAEPAAATPAPQQPPTPQAPQWPSAPQWPAQPAASSDSLAFLTARRGPSGSEALWAASSRDVLAAPAGAAAATAGVQSCVSCGLSLSANARFCRRCGTRQHD